MLKEFTWLENHRIDIVYGRIYSVYCYVFEEFHAVYVGLSLKPRKRDSQHRDGKMKSSVFSFAKEKSVDVPEMKILEDGLTQLEAREKEGEHVERYRNEGWNVLNKAKCGRMCGSVGAMGRKWTYERCLEVAKGCRSKAEFKKRNASAYAACRDHGWLQKFEWL